MVESSDEPSLLDRIRSSARRAHASNRPSGSTREQRPPPSLRTTSTRSNAGIPAGSSTSRVASTLTASSSAPTSDNVAEKTASSLPPPAPPPLAAGDGEASSSIGDGQQKKPNILLRFYEACKDILSASWLNVLLVFVPVGIAVQAAGVDKTIVFAMNAIAIIPLAGLLSYATENVAADFGDTIGAFMNITFGNAVELIIFIALTKNEIRIVQASLLGSILANLLLILGMCFLFGGLRFREQIYNSTVTQMSACLLSLSVISLLLPTAFHASFANAGTADKAVLQISRGTSVILLLVYVLYLLFQMKSHAYMYQSTPQHVIDEESHPGVLAEMLNSSSSSESSSTSSSSDSDGSSGSNTTAKRIKRVLRGRKRRKSSASSSKDTPSFVRTPSASTFGHSVANSEAATQPRDENHVGALPALVAIASGDEADTDGEHDIRSNPRTDTTITRDFENEKSGSGSKSPELRLKKKMRRKHRKHAKLDDKQAAILEENALPELTGNNLTANPSTPRVGFVQDVQAAPESSPKRPFTVRGLSVREIVPAMPPMPKVLSNTVFSSANPTGGLSIGSAPTGITPRALHRSSSLPGRLNQLQSGRQQSNSPVQPPPFIAPVNATHTTENKDDERPKRHMSRTTAVILLLTSTGLVAVCAEFLVASIDYLISNTTVSEAFIGLIVLPIVGNAAEHVTAVTVASKNKMDLAIGVAVGSSIQIALFVTPVIVLLGWILAKDMSLYFSLFETVSLFASAFIVNFLVLDGRSNYLEGALLIAAYIIIALAAFFFPDQDEQSSIGGGDAIQAMFRMF